MFGIRVERNRVVNDSGEIIFELSHMCFVFSAQKVFILMDIHLGCSCVISWLTNVLGGNQAKKLEEHSNGVLQSLGAKRLKYFICFF